MKLSQLISELSDWEAGLQGKYGRHYDPEVVIDVHSEAAAAKGYLEIVGIELRNDAYPDLAIKAR